MDSNTETFTAIAKQIVALVREALRPQTPSEPKQVTIAEVEQTFRETLRQLGAEALSQFLSSGAGTPAAELACSCGGTVRYQRRREASLTTVFGKIRYERAYYAGCGCGHGQAPVDAQYGLVPGAMTSGLAALLGLAGIEFGFDESRAWLRAFLLFDVSENTVRSETQTFGALQAQREAALQRQSQDETYLQARLREPAPTVQRLYGSIDAAKVRIEPRPKAGKKPDSTEQWRDLKVGTWYEAEAVPAAQRSPRQRAKFEREHAVFRAKHIRYYCDLCDAENFGRLMWATGCATQADLIRELVFVCDGAVWIWNLIQRYYPQAVQIVDWFHAADRLQTVAHAAFAAGAERDVWRETVTTDLWEGRVDAVIRACERLATACPAAREAMTYFTNHAQRMHYDRYRAAGYLIGSGTVESGCKQIVAQRLKQPGAQWEVPGAVQTAKARAAWLSGEWPTLCTQRAALPLAI